MLRYIAFAWNALQSAESEAATILQGALRDDPTWRAVSVQRGFAAYCKAVCAEHGDVHALSHGSGVIFGTLFCRNADVGNDTAMRKAMLGPKQVAEIVSTDGRKLISSYWGHYVALLHNSAKQSTRILRGPMSDLPCFVVSFKGVSIVFSRMEDAIALKLLNFSINWSYLFGYVAFRDPKTRETGIKEVSSVLVGECVELTPGHTSRHFYWHPCAIARSDAIEDATQAARLIRLNTRLCVDAWASCHKTILHRLSGGLDSSIVLSCLNGALDRPNVTCLNLYSRGARGDERKFARLVAHRFSCNLVERERDPNLNLEVIQTIRMTARPVRDFSSYDSYQPELQMARERAASGIFCGEMGDAVFEHGTGRWAAVEFVRRHGIRPKLLKVSFDVAEYRQTSVWRVLGNAVRSGLFEPQASSWAGNLYGLNRAGIKQPSMASRSCISSEVLEDVERHIDRYMHPWCLSARGVSVSKLWMISSLTPDACAWCDGPFLGLDDIPTIAPLTSQPLVELALRIPSYLNVHGGRDRAMAREAFTNDLPLEIATRTAKGAPSLWIRDLLKRNNRFVREMLLDGLLVSEGLLDRRKVETALADAPTKSLVTDPDIFRHLYTESWLRRWVRGELRTAA